MADRSCLAGAGGDPRPVQIGPQLGSLSHLTGFAAARLALTQPERVAVMVNDRVLRRSDLDATGLSGGDSVEIVTFAGGGDARFERTGR